MKGAIIFYAVSGSGIRRALDNFTEVQDVGNVYLNETYKRPAGESCFTQGIYIDDDQSIVETCGVEGESRIRRYRLKDDEDDEPEVLIEQNQDADIFLEGMARIGNTTWTLTWLNKEILVQDSNFGESKPTNTLPWNYTQGWGLTTDGCKFFATTSEDFIVHLDPKTGEELKRVQAMKNGVALSEINDMVYITPFLWVNVWHESIIYRVDPDTGVVDKSFDLTTQIPYAKTWNEISALNPDHENCPNGLAYHFDMDPNGLFVTGKRWPSLFKLHFEDADLCGGDPVDSNREVCAAAPKSPCWPRTSNTELEV